MYETPQTPPTSKRVATPRKRKSAPSMPSIVTPEDYLMLQAKAMTEKPELQSHVNRILRQAGWDLAYHTWNSIHSAKGFLDEFAFKETDDTYWILVAELKKEDNALTAEQVKWHTMWTKVAWAINSAMAFSGKLLHAMGFKTVRVEVHIWRPSDYYSGAIEAIAYKPTGAIIGARRQVGKRVNA